jgi:hypothetical protein
MAEEARFELAEGLTLRRFSRPVHSATLPPLRSKGQLYIGFLVI